MVEDLIRQYINQVNILQLATSKDDQPWIVTVYFYADENHNIYWNSRPNRRHSQDIESNPNVAAILLIHENTASEDWVIGLTISGQAKIIENLDDKLSEVYISKLLKDPDLPAKIKNGTDPAKWYRLKPSSLVLFDTKDFPTDPRQEVTL
jgi:nitroimidazol reductase NimA-like FMN-containing flavoprotein (pyridoxamine 5'-phosphate oxidase superfamily)